MDDEKNRSSAQRGDAQELENQAVDLQRGPSLESQMTLSVQEQQELIKKFNITDLMYFVSMVVFLQRSVRAYLRKKYNASMPDGEQQPNAESADAADKITIIKVARKKHINDGLKPSSELNPNESEMLAEPSIKIHKIGDSSAQGQSQAKEENKEGNPEKNNNNNEKDLVKLLEEEEKKLSEKDKKRHKVHLKYGTSRNKKQLNFMI